MAQNTEKDVNKAVELFMKDTKNALGTLDSNGVDIKTKGLTRLIIGVADSNYCATIYDSVKYPNTTAFSLNFTSGSNQYGTFGTALPINNGVTFTLSLWFKTTSVSQTSGIWASETGAGAANNGIVYIVNQTLEWYGDGGSFVSGNVLAINTWYNVIISRSSVSGKDSIFLNNSLLGTCNRTNTATTMTTYMGTDNNGRPFTGNIATVNVWGRTLTGAEKTLLNAGGSPSATSQLASWTFPEGSGVTTADQIGSNNGTLSNGVVWSTSLPAVIPTGGTSLGTVNIVQVSASTTGGVYAGITFGDVNAPHNVNGKSINFQIGGVTDMALSKNGQLGIGTIAPAYTLDVNGSINIELTGKLNIATGTNATAGTATLSSGTVVVSTTAVTTSSIIEMTYQNCSGCALTTHFYVSTRTAGTSFTIVAATATGTNAADGSNIGWVIIN